MPRRQPKAELSLGVPYGKLMPSHPFPDRFETGRLTYERLSRETVDIIDLFRVLSRDEGIDEVTEFMPWYRHRTPKQTLDFVTRRERKWADARLGTWLVRLKEPESAAETPGDIVGVASLTPDWKRHRAESAVLLRKRFWGRRYSGERAAKMLDIVFDRLDLELYFTEHNVDNDRSRRAIERYVARFGGQHEGRLRNQGTRPDGTATDQDRYTITKAQYRNAVADRAESQ
ncbi:GNAT family N-acetyltransferase [Haloferacaceae archaeon DSL9]